MGLFINTFSPVIHRKTGTYPQGKVDNMLAERLFWGALLGLAAGWLGYKAGALDLSGALAAWFVGAITFGFGGWQAAGLLIAFFISSSVLSRLAGRRKTLVEADFSKGDRRDWGQVLANGGWAGVLAVCSSMDGSQLWLATLVGSLAAVNADTWATELGVLSKRRPRLITTWRPVRAGVSGGVTLEGLLASLAGAGLIAVLGAWWLDSAVLVGAGLLGGFTGSLVDSLLGASVQVMYTCPSCNKETERHPAHSCGTPTQAIRGWPWLNNDGVNFIAAGAGAAVAALVVFLTA
jgi:uncharacterized protein (TIGR00297 family)